MVEQLAGVQLNKRLAPLTITIGYAILII